MNFFPASRRAYAAIVLALIAVIFFALNIFTSSAFRMSRIDLTETGLYTTAKGTRELLAGLKEPLTLRLYYSETIATRYEPVRAYGEQVQDLLNEFAALSHGKLQVEVIKPEPFSPQEDQASAAGMTPIQSDTGETLYFGLEASNLADGRETIPYFSPDRRALVEYDIISIIDRLSRSAKPKIGLITNLELSSGAAGPQAMMSGRGVPYAIYDQLKTTYDLVELKPDQRVIPDDIKVVIIAQPQGVTQSEFYSIDQYVMRGGRVLAFADPMSEMQVQQAMGNVNAVFSANFGPLFKSWGVDVPMKELVGDRTLAQRVMLGGDSNRIISYLPWLGLTAADVNDKDPVVADLTALNIASAGHIVAQPGATTVMTPMLTSSDDAMVLDPEEVRYTPDPELLLRNFQPSGERYVLAARITGPATTAFPDGPPPPEPVVGKEGEPPPAPADQTPLPPQVKTAEKGVNIIVVADTDLLDEKFWAEIRDVQGQRVAVPNAANGTLVLNAIDNLLGSDALLTLRGRIIPDRRFDVVDAIRREADQSYLAKQDSLRQSLSATEARLTQLEQQGGVGAGGDVTITPEQRQEIMKARADIAQTRAELRAVQLNLRKDIDKLYNVLRVINIVLLPLAVALAGIALFIVRRSRREALGKAAVRTTGTPS